MRIWIIRDKRDAIIFTLTVTLIVAAIAAATTSAVFSIVQPETHLAYVINATLIAVCVAPVFAYILASNVLYIQRIRTQLAEQAHADPLTGLMNRRAFQEMARKELRRMERTDTKACLVYVDIDHFKHINDVHGHTAGDHVLQAIGGALQDNIRPSMDLVARWGGEEFVLLIAETDLAGAALAAERLRGVIDALYPSIGRVCIGVTASFGVTELQPGQSLDQAFDRADHCLYEAKASGRNRVIAAKSDGLRVVA